MLHRGKIYEYVDNFDQIAHFKKMPCLYHTSHHRETSYTVHTHCQLSNEALQPMVLKMNDGLKLTLIAEDERVHIRE